MDPATIAAITQVAGQIFGKMGDKGGDSQSLGQLMQMLGGLTKYDANSLPQAQGTSTQIGGGY